MEDEQPSYWDWLRHYMTLLFPHMTQQQEAEEDGDEAEQA
jgi:hypothetical protein